MAMSRSGGLAVPKDVILSSHTRTSAAMSPLTRSNVLRNRLYFLLKPVIPQSVRMGIRRCFAVRKRAKVRDIWPIMPGSERPPEGWPGWPEGRKFAVVLTHDVEGQAGLDNCRRLMRLEMELGFRSSFNFVPEGDYTVPRELREELVQNGFEVGIHDLRHDGRLYDSRVDFRKAAMQINRYLSDWDAVGFRSAFMLHNLDWLHELNIQYDLSTFDSDPFEPQPEGKHTIFPFWVPGPGGGRSEVRGQRTEDGSQKSEPTAGVSRSGYVELPYTLPQDSTLFLLLKEKSPEIWLQKLDWIAGHGGMALVNVHPDYLRFEGEPESKRTFPVAHYRQLLERIQQGYAGMFWHPLPKQLAAMVGNNLPHSTLL